MPTPYASPSWSARPLASWCTATRPGVPAPATYSSRTRWPGAFGATMITSCSAGGDDPPEVDVQPVREQHRGARLEVRRDVLVPHALLHVVGDEHRHHLRAANGVGDGARVEPGVLGRGARAAAVAQADLHLDAGVVEVERVRVALAAEADDGDLAVEEGEIAVAVDGRHRVVSFSWVRRERAAWDASSCCGTGG